MITATQIHERVQRYIQNIRHRLSMAYDIVPKQATVVDVTECGVQLGYTKGSAVSESGRAYPHFWLPQRVTFFPEPLTLGNESRYKELKGYGENSRALFPSHHEEGDLFFGMYLSIAEKEYTLLKTTMQLPQVRSQQAVALMQFSQEEFHRHALRGLAMLMCYTELGDNEESNLRHLEKQTESQGLEKVIHDVQQQLAKKGSRREFSIIEKPAGYLVRLTRCPFRLPCGKTHNVSQTDLQEAAYEGGKLYHELLSRGWLHLVPAAGNITLAGELMDFEDVVPITDHKEICKGWEFMAEQFHKEQPVETLSDYLALTLGKKFLEDFSTPLLEGACLPADPRKAAEAIIAQHESALKPLLDKRVHVQKKRR